MSIPDIVPSRMAAAAPVMSDPEGLARKLAACLSAHGETDWRRFVPLAEDVGGGLNPADSHDEDTGASLRSAVPDAAFLRRILLGLVAAALVSGAVTVALWVQTAVAA